MIRFAFGLLLAASLVSCDSADTDAFSLDVTVRDASGAPVSGLTVVLDTDLGAVNPTSETPAQTASTFQVSSPYPNPYGIATEIRLNTFAGIAASGEIEVLDLEGRPLHSMGLSGLEPNQSISVPLGAVAGLTGQVMPGGVYRIRTTIGTETVERGLVRTENNLGGIYPTYRRTLGTTDARGQIGTSDRQIMPALYTTVPALFMTDDQGSELGVLYPPHILTVLVTDGDHVEEAHVELRDGANRVDVTWGR